MLSREEYLYLLEVLNKVSVSGLQAQQYHLAVAGKLQGAVQELSKAPPPAEDKK